MASRSWVFRCIRQASRPRTRAKHLSDIHIPLLFVQGTRDKLAELSLLEPLVSRLGAAATLHLVREGDHSFHVLARSGRNDRDAMGEVVNTLSNWIAATTAECIGGPAGAAPAGEMPGPAAD